MNRYLIALAFVILISSSFTKSPHGDDFNRDCDNCHTVNTWNEIIFKKNGFNHGQNKFPLTGQHSTLDCRKCHSDLQFGKEQSVECSSCHTDVHQQTVGQDCARCHSTTSWNVNNVVQIHNETTFPLLGQHRNVDCYQCHNSETRLRFELLKTECVECHLADYNNSTNPPHRAANFSKECAQCHDQRGWEFSSFNHNSTSFPLTGAHTVTTCVKCHTSNVTLTNECNSCHLSDYNASENPNHKGAKFSDDCITCHKTNTWKPASGFNHNSYYKISSGGHSNLECSECHTNSANYTIFTCQTSSCHGDAHNREQGSDGCYSCHVKH